jgi:GNAT superfamily N-acetyltransferase
LFLNLIETLDQTIEQDIEAIEEAVISQWSAYGHAPGGTWHRDKDVIWAEAPIPQLPYNAVVHSKLPDDAGERIDQLIEHFRTRGVQFLWLVHPSATPTDLAKQLESRGLAHVEDVTGMALDLGQWHPVLTEPCGPVEVREVTDETTRKNYEELLLEYWELPEESQFYAVGLSEWGSKDIPGARWVAYNEGKPVGKAYLSLESSAESTAIFGVFVSPEARGYGIAGWLSQLAIERSKQVGAKRVVLHASSMARSIYKKLGFVERCTIELYGTTSLHSPQLI